MIKKNTKTINIDIDQAIICDICGLEATKDYSENADEWDEFTHIRLQAGYGSVFGDGNMVEIDICQHCLKKTFGEKLRIIEQKY